jgi:ABC-2 type transport system permease protein
MRMIDLALKDLLQIARDRKTAIYLVLMPLVFTLFFGLIFSSTGKGGDTRLPVGFVNQDPSGALSKTLYNLLERSEAIRPVLLEGDQAAKVADAVRDDKLAAAVIVPADFSRQALMGAIAPLRVIVDENKIAGQAASGAIRMISSRLLSMVQTAQLSAQASTAQKAFESEAARQAYMEQALTLAAKAWDNAPLVVKVEKGPQTTQASNSYVQASPGMIVQFAIYGLMMAGTVLVLERKSRTLQRLMTTPITRTQVIAGKVLAMFLMVFLQEALLVVIGQFAFGVDYLREPVAILLVMGALALWAASLGLFIGAISKGEEQVIMYTLLAMFILAAMGGAWFPLEITGKTFSTIGHLLPTAWAMDGFQNIILRGLGLSSVFLPAGILVGYAVVFFGLAIWRLEME